jgi:hypothetical protein
MRCDQLEVERIRNELKAAGESLEEAKKQIEQKEKSECSLLCVSACFCTHQRLWWCVCVVCLCVCVWFGVVTEWANKQLNELQAQKSGFGISADYRIPSFVPSSFSMPVSSSERLFVSLCYQSAIDFGELLVAVVLCVG